MIQVRVVPVLTLWSLTLKQRRNKLGRMIHSPESKVQFQYQQHASSKPRVINMMCGFATFNSKSVKTCAPGLGHCTKVHREGGQDGPFCV